MADLVSYQNNVEPRVTGAPTYATGKFGQCVTTPLLRGVAPTPDAFMATPGLALGTGTVEAWIKSSATSLRVALSHPGSYWLGHNASGFLMLDYGVLPNNTTLTTSVVVNDGAWHHVAIVFQAGAASVYVDGNRAAQSANAPVTDGDNTDVNKQFLVGGLWANGFDWTGAVDDVRISNVARYTGTTYTVPTAQHTADANAVHTWRLDGTLAEASAEVGPTPVTATAPTKSDVSGTSSDTYTIPTKTGVEYRIGGVAKAAGTYPTGGATSVAITAVATSGYSLTGTSSWTLTFSTATDPDPDPDPDPEPGVRYRLGFEPLVWDGSAYPTRHPGAASVTYIGPSEPAGWQPNDMWVQR